MITDSQMLALAEQYGTPVYIYDEQAIRQKAKSLNSTFAQITFYKNYFAVKATPTPAILKVLHEEGMGFDCSSRTELLMMQHMNVAGEDIFYTSNNTPLADFELAISLNATVNIDDLTQIPVFTEALKGKPYNRAALRYNPGNLKEGNAIIGDPVEAKYGLRLDQLADGVKQLAEAGVEKIGLHAMVASNELGAQYFIETANIVADAAAHIKEQTGHSFDFINLGGGFGLNYKKEKADLDLNTVAEGFKLVQERLGNIPFYTENGRFITGPHAYLLTKVQYVMEKHKNYIGVDASMHNLMRPGMYGAHHTITVLGNHTKATQKFDVVGSLCENNDKFAIDRELPNNVKAGNVLAIHDVGAHGHAMGFNYNGLLRSAEVLVHADATSTVVRRAETPEDYFKTVVW